MRVYEDEAIPHEDETEAEGKRKLPSFPGDARAPDPVTGTLCPITAKQSHATRASHNHHCFVCCPAAVLVWTTKKLITDNKLFVRKLKEKYGKDWVSFLLADDYCFDHELRVS